MQCLRYSRIVVSGAGTALANGIYVPNGKISPGGGLTERYTIFTLEGDLRPGEDGFPCIKPIRISNTTNHWEIRGTSDSNVLYRTASITSNFDCPVGHSWTVVSGASPAPTITFTEALWYEQAAAAVAFINRYGGYT